MSDKSKVDYTLKKPPWHYPLLRPYRVPSLNLFVWVFWDCSHVVVPFTKLHRFDILRPNHRKWWWPPICGFQIWGRSRPHDPESCDVANCPECLIADYGATS